MASSNSALRVGLRNAGPARCRLSDRPDRQNYPCRPVAATSTRPVSARLSASSASAGHRSAWPAHRQKGLVARISAPTSNRCGRSLQSALMRSESAAPVNWESLQRRRPLETYPNLMETTYGRGVPPRNALPDRRTSRHACDPPAYRHRHHRDNASAMTAGHRRRRPENVCAFHLAPPSRDGMLPSGPPDRRTSRRARGCRVCRRHRYNAIASW